MTIAITASGPSLEDELDKRFGRAETILVYDTDTHFVEVINNAAGAPSGGAGIAAAQRLVDRDVAAVITGQVGPNALRVLEAAGIRLVQGFPGSAKSNLDAFKAGNMGDLQQFVPPHSGK
ncbi:MAG: NifB/NifX family molybdenum-iron cluster-binding protein [Eubacteriales bacterium]|nr:NifB/NifX family molybdenum-iron cluster-binding protein [Eubacteriales bacterium]